MKSFVDVAVPVGVRKTFVYSVPERFRNRMAVGVRVLVPFGTRILTGVVVAMLSDRPKGNFEVRSIRDLVDATPILSPSVIGAALFVARHYFTPVGEVLRAALPPGTQISIATRIRLSPQTERLIEGGLRPSSLRSQEYRVLHTLHRHGPLTPRELAKASGLKAIAAWTDRLAAEGWIETEESQRRPRASPRQVLGIRAQSADPEVVARLPRKQREMYESLRSAGKLIALQECLHTLSASVSTARALESKKLVEVKPLQVYREPFELTARAASTAHTLTTSQQEVFDRIRMALTRNEPQRFLLHGVTGSGKTEIYLRLIAEILELRQTAILLVPEISLTPLLSRIAHSHFPDKVALLHSGMSPGERLDQWRRIRSGAAPVVVGTRSAVFAPLEDLRLVILDEEQDGSYKQDESPHYHAREVAWYRLQQSRGVLLLASATPSVETYYLAREKGEISYHCLTERIQARPMPEVHIVDMSLEFERFGKRTIVSQVLRSELERRLARGEQAIVLLNRRGYSRSLLCRSCGHVFGCPDCSVPMTYHQKEQRLICHYCGGEKATPTRCVSCGGEYIYFTGVGTEQLEEILRTMFPTARMARLDRDTTRRRGVLAATLTHFSEGKLDILMGTQMLAKGHDFPNVTLVGVVGADGGLCFPDFRSAELTFQLLTQVAGRAGRGTIPGKVVLQSFYPEHYALQYARRQDYDGFYTREIEYRRLMMYPPYSKLVQIMVTEPRQLKAAQVADRVAKALERACLNHGLEHRVRVLGPAVAPIEKLRGKYRHQILLKSEDGREAIEVLESSFQELGKQRVALKNVSVDVDPLSLL